MTASGWIDGYGYHPPAIYWVISSRPSRGDGRQAMTAGGPGPAEYIYKARTTRGAT